VAPSSITIELTETTVMHDSLLAMEAMVRLRLRGFELSIDDFGTGYSSLVRLQQLPFTEVKIDRSFVSLKRRSRENEKIVRAIAQLALGLDLKCVIEGIEDEDCLNFAGAVGCTAAQGYFISRALPPEQFPLFMKEWHLRQDWLRGRAVERVTEAEESAEAKAARLNR
jgi:EAL domain-containing protein (putative c-di-GMP-specific phosphodiesterase class I)